jgi:ribosome biogenesis GTPase
MKGKVYKSTGSWYLVKTADGNTWNARLRGTFKMDGITSTNPVVVGDEVTLEIENEDEHSAMISRISDRKNYIIRQSPSHKMHQHIVAANIDQSLLIVTLKHPKTSQGFIDRFLVTSEAYHIPAIIVLNKADIYGKKELEKFSEWEEMYQEIGYKIMLMSISAQTGLELVKDLLQGKVSLVSGPSGVGKSSFINAVFPSMHQKTQDVSGWSGKGLHTTSFAEMFDLPQGGQIMDTPGIREFGLVDITRQELSHYFPEMRDRLQDCQFNNCLHADEPGCAIKKALEEGEIFADRYISYRKILDTIEENTY